MCRLDSTEALIDPDPGPGVVTMRRTLKQDLPRVLLTQHKRESRIKKKKGVGGERRETKSMGFVWRGNSGVHSPPRPLSHLSLLSSTPRANKRPCVAAAGLELHRPCVRPRWTTQTDRGHSPSFPPPASSQTARHWSVSHRRCGGSPVAVTWSLFDLQSLLLVASHGCKMALHVAFS